MRVFHIVLPCASLLALAPISHSSNAAEQGYAVITPSATTEQRDLLAVVVSLQFPPGVTTVGDALDVLLERSGYRLAYGAGADPNLPTLMQLPLPQVHRSLGPIRLRDALQALAGGAWVLVEDPVNRLVCFDLDVRYRAVKAPTEGGV